MFNEVEHSGFNNWGGPLYIGIGCFHRGESLLGRKYSHNYEEDWMRGNTEMKTHESTSISEEKAEALITCTYENNTLWGKELGLKYGCPVEDVLTGLAIQCRGWISISYNSSRRGF